MPPTDKPAHLTYRSAVAEIHTRSEGDWHATIELHGEIDAAAAPALGELLDEHLADGRRILHVDLRRTTFLDSAATTVLLNAHHRCTDVNGSLILVGLQPPVDRVLRLTGLDRVLLVDNGGGAPNGESPESPDARLRLIG